MQLGHPNYSCYGNIAFNRGFLWHEKGLWIFRGLLMCFCVYIYVYESCKCVLGGSVDGEVGFSYT